MILALWYARVSAKSKQRADAPAPARHHQQPFPSAEDREARIWQSHHPPVDADRSQTTPGHGAAQSAVYHVQQAQNTRPDVPPRNCAPLPAPDSGLAALAVDLRRNSRLPTPAKNRLPPPLLQLQEQPYTQPGDTQQIHNQVCDTNSCTYVNQHTKPQCTHCSISSRSSPSNHV